MTRSQKIRGIWPEGVLAFLAFGIAGYAIASYLTGNPLQAGFLQGKAHYQHFVPTTRWTAALVLHVAGGSLALLVGALQWLLASWTWKTARPSWFRTAHVVLGLTYLGSIVVGAGAGLVLVPQAMGGPSPLGDLVFSTCSGSCPRSSRLCWVGACGPVPIFGCLITNGCSAATL
ncbi:MAG: hypothetical protein IPN71_10545 [Fibrobacteres bacterium]|nr:hypothetical protein [Fibrobacterota bacterium]